MAETGGTGREGQPEPARATEHAPGTAAAAQVEAPAPADGDVPRPWTVRETVIWVVLGLAAGVLSGLFGIGGGTIIVPGLVLAGMSQRRAAATSLAAIVPTSIAAVVSYAAGGHIDYGAGLLLALGIVVGAQGGSWLLSRLPERVLRWAFVAFLALVVVQQLVFIPSRDSQIVLTLASGAGLVALGLVTGILSGVLGIGGGIIVVPTLSAVFAASDLIARGTSLLTMIPGAVSGTISNTRRGLVDLRSGLVVGLVAAASTPAGAFVARSISPRAGAVAFAVYVSVLVVRSTYTALRSPER